MNKRGGELRRLIAVWAILGSIAGAQAVVPSIQDILVFEAHPVQPVRSPGIPDFDITRDDIERILTTYRVVSEVSWTTDYHHVAFADRTGTLTLRNGTIVTWLVRPGGLARLSFPNGTRVHLARASGLVPAEVRLMATDYRDRWLAESKPEDAVQLARGTIVSVEQGTDGWHVTFETRTGDGPAAPEGLHIYYLHVHLDVSGRLLRVVRGPDAIS